MPEPPSAALPRARPVPDPVQSQDLPISADVANLGTTAQADRINHSSPDQPPRQKKAAKNRKDVVCRYSATKNGCRAGEACPYLHDSATAGRHNGQPQFPNKGTKSQENEPAATVAQPVAEQQDIGGHASSSNLPKPPVQRQRTTVDRPIPKAEATNPRDFQIGQMYRRYSPTKTEDDNGTTLVFHLQPSDPDFPFELRHGLACMVVVPKGFPGNAKPTLRVSNAEMARGYQINVERGFETLVDQHPHLNLLKLMNELDKNLEMFLTAQKAETVKISVNASKTVGPTQPPVAPVVLPVPAAPPVPRESAFSDKQKVEAKSKRESEVRQLEARMGKLPLFSRSADGTSFEVPLQIPKPSRLPPSLQSLKDVTLLVPTFYNLEPCSIVIKSVDSQESRNVERSFAKKSREQPQLSLMAHVNALSQNMHVMAEETEEKPIIETTARPTPVLAEVADRESPAHQVSPSSSSAEGKSHIVVIPRPPEWSAPDDESCDDDSSEEYESEEEPTDEEEDGGAPVPVDAIEQRYTGPDLGISLSFPFLELYGIELLKVSSISISLKCDRCKTIADIKNLQPSQTKTESCSKCANLLSVGYRGELMHSNAIRGGYLDLDGCIVADLLPSTFVPTCSTCSTDFKAGAISVRGESTLAVCRECHAKMSFKIPEVKFLRISAGPSTKDRGLPRKRPKENLGITAGQELPRKGRCQHYGKSYRWFRFGCCNKVYACDRCHDAAEEHPNEHANRMICGWCSREQTYRPEDCVHCHNGLVGKKGGGFWEGGKGTRDKNQMSRKDPRKYKRRGGSKVGGGGK